MEKSIKFLWSQRAYQNSKASFMYHYMSNYTILQWMLGFQGTWEKNMSNENVKMDVIIQEKIEYEMKFYKDWYNIHWKKYEKN